MTQDNRPAVYTEGSTVIYRASALGGCLKSLWAARSNLDRRPIPKVIQDAMDEGTEMESMILDLLHERHGFDFADSRQEQVELIVGAYNGMTMIVRGKVDELGCMFNPTLPRGAQTYLPIDVKKWGQSLVDSFLSHGWAGVPKYAWQQSVYAEGFNTHVFIMPVYNKHKKEIEPWSLVPVPQQFTRDDIAARVIEVEIAYADGKIPDSWECPGDYACQYPYLHEGKSTDSLPGNAVPLLKARIAVSEKIGMLENAKKELDKKIRPLLAPDTQYHLDGNTITVIGNPNRFNTNYAKSILKEAGVEYENDPDFWTPGEGTQLRINKPKNK